MEQVSRKFMNWASILEDNTKAQVEIKHTLRQIVNVKGD